MKIEKDSYNNFLKDEIIRSYLNGNMKIVYLQSIHNVDKSVVIDALLSNNVIKDKLISYEGYEPCKRCRKNSFYHKFRVEMGFLAAIKICSNCTSKKKKSYRKIIKEKTIKSSEIGIRIKKILSNARRRSLKKRLDFEINFEIIWDLFRRQSGLCSISGIALNGDPNSPYSISIGRIDSNVGYTKNNIQLVCLSVNLGKNKFDNCFIKKTINSSNGKNEILGQIKIDVQENIDKFYSKYKRKTISKNKEIIRG